MYVGKGLTCSTRLVLTAALLLTSTACQSDPPNDKAKLAVFDTEPRSQPAPVAIFDLKRQQQTVAAVSEPLTPMTPADIRRSAMTCLQSPPYPVDGGPMCLRPDGSWIVYSGWGNPLGRYTIVGNEVRLFDRARGGGIERIAFFRSTDGGMFLRHMDQPDMPFEPFEPYGEADYLNAG